MPDIISVDSLAESMDAICRKIAGGELIAIPTETVYGLAGDATNGIAVAKIFQMKGRPQFNPLICHVSGTEMAEAIGEFSPLATKLAKAFWPGPLTLVLPLNPDYGIHPLVTANLNTVGLRFPKGPAADVIEACDRPLAAPSANRSGKISPTSAGRVAREFPNEQLTIIDAGACSVGLESTVVKVNGDSLKILRPGSITGEMIQSETGIMPESIAGGDGIEAPGMMASHYAPNARLLINQRNCPSGAALLAFGAETDCNRDGAIQTMNLSPGGDLIEAAANLYESLHVLDSAGHEVIAVEPIPTNGLGIAINDRLNRAAAPKPGVDA